MYSYVEYNNKRKVVNIERNFRSSIVYNLTVNNYHTYFVGNDSLLVHNQNKNTGCKIRGRKAKGYNWDGIFKKHSASGNVAKQRTRTKANTVFPAHLTNKQIKSMVKGAWKNRELRRSQFDPESGATRLLYEGIDPVSGSKIGMWFDSATQIVTTAFPK